MKPPIFVHIYKSLLENAMDKHDQEIGNLQKYHVTGALHVF